MLLKSVTIRKFPRLLSKRGTVCQNIHGRWKPFSLPSLHLMDSSYIVNLGTGRDGTNLRTAEIPIHELFSSTTEVTQHALPRRVRKLEFVSDLRQFSH